jgi:hypothetical protein
VLQGLVPELVVSHGPREGSGGPGSR